MHELKAELDAANFATFGCFRKVSKLVRFAYVAR